MGPGGPVLRRKRLSGANLANDVGSGYRFGYFDEDLRFEELGETDEKGDPDHRAESPEHMVPNYDRRQRKIYLLQLGQRGHCGGLLPPVIDSFRRFDDAAEEAEEYDAASWLGSTGNIRSGVGAYLSKGGRPGRRR